MYSKIVVPLDGSKLAEGILPYARTIARVGKVPVEFLHVIDPEVIAAFTDQAHGRHADRVEADMKRQGLAYLRPLSSSFPEPGIVRCSVLIGEPAEIIVEEAAAQAKTLIAMATHGRSGMQRWLLGSVADKVLHMTGSHLLLARAAEQAGVREAVLKSIVVPLDGSELAERVLPSVVALAGMMDLQVLLLRAYALPSSIYASDEYIPNLPELIEEIKKETEDYLEEKVRHLLKQGVRRVAAVALEGDGSAEIIDFARKTPDNLVAMSTHGRSGVRRILGSVTDRVVRNSWDPVLIMPPGTRVEGKRSAAVENRKAIA